MDDNAPTLNQLKLFDALYQFRSITEVARRLEVPQPTLSRWLGQLRLHFRDPLFVRTSAGMEPTPEAQRVAAAVAQVLLIHREALRPVDSFVPSLSTRRFHIAASDFGHVLFLPKIQQALRESAPHMRLVAVGLGRRSLITELENGGVDLAIGGFPSLAAGVKEQTLFTCGHVCLVRAGHPAADALRARDLAVFKTMDHAIVSAHELGHIHEAVEARLLEVCAPERVRIVSESFIVSALLTLETDLVVTVPARLAEWFAARLQLRIVPAPLELPLFEVKQYWHERFDLDPPNVWLRRCVAAAHRTVLTPTAPVA